MKRMLFALTLTAACTPALAADVGLSVSIAEPGFYGRLDIGNVEKPAVINTQPVVIQTAPVAVVQQPVYLHVPPGHSKNWGKYCGNYNACGQPVYFVKDDWVNNVYVPEKHGKGKGGHGHGKGKKD